MSCNCNIDENVLQITAGTTYTNTFTFEEDISSYSGAIFTIRKDYQTAPVIQLNLSITDPHTIDLTIDKTETANFTDFQNGKNSASYIWGLDLYDTTDNLQVNVFPVTGEPAPLCIVYKHVCGEQ